MLHLRQTEAHDTYMDFLCVVMTNNQKVCVSLVS